MFNKYERIYQNFFLEFLRKFAIELFFLHVHYRKNLQTLKINKTIFNIVQTDV